MKWATFTCLFFLSFAEPEPLTEKAETLSLFDTTFSSFQEFKEIVGLFYAQTIQKATSEELTKIAHGVEELAKKCTVDKQADPECAKPLETLLFDQCCHEEGLAEKYGLTECCGKAHLERQECFLSLQNTSVDFLPSFEEPAAEERCKGFQEDAAATLGLYTYQVGRRYPNLPISMLLGFIHIYENMVTTCCQEAEKEACLNEKALSVAKDFTEAYQVEKHICSILGSYGKRGIHALKFTQLSQQFPKASVATINKLAIDITQAQEHCCKGHNLECYIEDVKLTTYICSHQDDISSKIEACCGKSLLNQATCLPTVENDDKPADLSPTLREFMDDEQLCPRYAEDRNPLMAEFVYEYGRRHSDYSPQMLLRLGEEYEDWLEKCCKAENRKECLVQAEEHLKKHITDNYNEAKESCDLYKHQGEDVFQYHFLLQYTPKLPQLPFEELSRLAKTISDATAKCCKMDDAHLLRCIEGYGDLVVGMVCQQHKEHPINKQVQKCCEDSYAYRVTCFPGLGVDPEYVPVLFHPVLFTLQPDISTAKPEDQQKQKQRFLYDLIKHKPTITYGQLTPVIMDLNDVVTKCSEADNHEECFTTEGPKLIERTLAALGDN